MASFVGTLKHVRFHNEETDFTVAVFEGDKGEELVAKGVFMNPYEDHTYQLTGEYDIYKHTDWRGREISEQQLSFKEIKEVMPLTVEAMEKYIVGSYKGIGQKAAHRICERFGKRSLEIIKNDPKKLLEISGIGEKLVSRIAEKNEDSQKLDALREELLSYKLNVTELQLKRIYDKYEDRAASVISQNPYCLVTDVVGLGFIKVDAMTKARIARRSKVRVEAGILYYFGQMLNMKGHICITRKALIGEDDGPLYYLNKNETGENIIIAQDILFCVKILCDKGRLIGEKADFSLYEKNGGQDSFDECVCFYLPSAYRNENEIASNLVRRKLSGNTDQNVYAINDEMIEKTANVKLAPAQKNGVIGALASQIYILTGGPGTGKTTTVNTIVSVFERLNPGKKVIMTAPTGRAAKRMSEVSKREAYTLHRFFKINPANMKNAEMSEDADFLIIDEFSMVDVPLFASVLKLIPDKTKILLVGDVDQLPSVGPGAVLKNLIASKAIPSTRLSVIFRQSDTSSIVGNAASINSGQTSLSWGDDFSIYSPDVDESLSDKDKSAAYTAGCADMIVRAYLKTRSQILLPGRKGACGVVEINRRIQESLFPGLPMLSIGNTKFTAGSRVMHIKNDYQAERSPDALGVFNGDIGTVISVNEKDKTMQVKFDDEDLPANVPADKVKNYELAYAITVHKSQGGEYPEVIMGVLPAHTFMLTRNLFYTGITRAKKSIVLIGSRKTVVLAIKNNKQQVRNSRLASRINYYLADPKKKKELLSEGR